MKMKKGLLLLILCALAILFLFACLLYTSDAADEEYNV